MLKISLSPEIELTLQSRAKANGEDVSSYAARLLQEALSTPSVDELLAPFREQVEASGLTDEELDELGHQLKRKVCIEKPDREAMCVQEDAGRCTRIDFSAE